MSPLSCRSVDLCDGRTDGRCHSSKVTCDLANPGAIQFERQTDRNYKLISSLKEFNRMPAADLNRRVIQFSNLDQIVEDIQELAKADVETVGNHPFAAIVDHLARTNDMLLGRLDPPKLPLMYRLLMPFIRKSIFNSEAKPGFKLPSAKLETFFWDDSAHLDKAIEYFKSTVEEFKRKGMPSDHPIFGPASPEQIENQLLAHASMHLSFVKPVIEAGKQ